MPRANLPLRSPLRILRKYFFYLFIFCFLGITTCALFLPAQANAHESDAKHLLLLQVEPEALLGLVVYEIPAGKSASVLRAMFDPDADAHLDPSQRAALAQKLSQDAVAGWVIRQDAKTLAATSLAWRLDIDEHRPDGGLLLALKIGFENLGAPVRVNPTRQRSQIIDLAGWLALFRAPLLFWLLTLLLLFCCS